MGGGHGAPVSRPSHYWNRKGLNGAHELGAKVKPKLSPPPSEFNSFEQYVGVGVQAKGMVWVWGWRSRILR